MNTAGNNSNRVKTGEDEDDYTDARLIYDFCRRTSRW